MSTEGACKIVKSLIQHPKIVCLDIGDCDIGDKALKYICELLPADGPKPGLGELVLSANPRITPRAWEKFSVALAGSSCLRALYLDYNTLGDTAGKMLVVAASGHKTLQVVDVEACDLSDKVGRLFMYLVQHFPSQLTHVLLEENDILYETKKAIRLALGESESEDSSDSDFDAAPANTSTKKTSKRVTKSRSKAGSNQKVPALAAPITTGTLSSLKVPSPGRKKGQPKRRPSKVRRQRQGSASPDPSIHMAMTTGSRSRPECKPSAAVSEVEEETEDEADDISGNYDVTYTFQPREDNDTRSAIVGQVKVGNPNEQRSDVDSLHVILPFDNDCNSSLHSTRSHDTIVNGERSEKCNVEPNESFKPLLLFGGSLAGECKANKRRNSSKHHKRASGTHTDGDSPLERGTNSGSISARFRGSGMNSTDEWLISTAIGRDSQLGGGSSGWDTDDDDSPSPSTSADREELLFTSMSCSELASLVESPTRSLSPQAILKESFSNTLHQFPSFKSFHDDCTIADDHCFANNPHTNKGHPVAEDSKLYSPYGNSLSFPVQASIPASSEQGLSCSPIMSVDVSPTHGLKQTLSNSPFGRFSDPYAPPGSSFRATPRFRRRPRHCTSGYGSLNGSEENHSSGSEDMKISSDRDFSSESEYDMSKSLGEQHIQEIKALIGDWLLR